MTMTPDAELARALARAQELEIEIARGWLRGLGVPVSISDDDMMCICRALRRLAAMTGPVPEVRSDGENA